MPKGENGAAQTLFALRHLLRREAGAVAVVEKLGNFALPIQRALAAHLCRMRGQDRANQRQSEEGLKIGAGKSRTGNLFESRLERAISRRGTGDGVSARASDMMLVFGDVGQMREVAERADNLNRGHARQAGQDDVEFGAGAVILVAVEAYRRLANALDKLENRIALLRPHRVAEQTPEYADVIPQRDILFPNFIRRLRGCSL